MSYSDAPPPYLALPGYVSKHRPRDTFLDDDQAWPFELPTTSTCVDTSTMSVSASTARPVVSLLSRLPQDFPHDQSSLDRFDPPAQRHAPFKIDTHIDYAALVKQTRETSILDRRPAGWSKTIEHPQDSKKQDQENNPDGKPIRTVPGGPWPTPVPLDIPQHAFVEPTLSEKQQQVLDTVLKGENFFFTGSAGVGKSLLLRTIIRTFRKNQEEHEARTGGRKRFMDARALPWNLAVTASTGMAAVNIGGTTLNSWSGVGMGTLEAPELARIVMKRNSARRRWREVSALVIDEISMVDGNLLDKLDYIARHVRNSRRPFGGIQVIISGDFFQLPPVDKGDSIPKIFAFQAKCWNTLIPRSNMVNFTEVFRQKDKQFVEILERMRKGTCLPEDETILRSCDRDITYEDGIGPVELYPSRQEARYVNESRLRALKTPLVEYHATDAPGSGEDGDGVDSFRATEMLDRNTQWVSSLQLKVGAMVMLVTNMGADSALINGSTGRVVDFMTIPQAASKGIFPSGRGYEHPKHPDSLWPIVEFKPSVHAGVPQYQYHIVPGMQVAVNGPGGRPRATRCQVPLILCWALTIHKGQGQTIDRLRIDLGRIHIPGQTYVAISRATSLETLELRHFDRSLVWAHPTVQDWSAAMEAGLCLPGTEADPAEERRKAERKAERAAEKAKLAEEDSQYGGW